jgi:hypothetical protein
MFKRLGFWIFDHVYLGPLAPWFLGVLLGSKPVKAEPKEADGPDQ